MVACLSLLSQLFMTEKMSLDSWDANEDGVAFSPEKLAAGEGGNFRATQPPAKKSRRAVQKRVVSVPVGFADGLLGKNGVGGEVFPPMDAWAWRKYGQKPIKGSPYPRGYYRCSSYKGCPARKQVERSHHDPTTLVVTYSFDHNHPGPPPKIARRHHAPPPPPAPEAGREEEKCLTSAAEEDPLVSMMMALENGGEFRWFTDVASPSSTSAGSDELLYGSVLFGGSGEAGLVPEERETVGAGEEDATFAGLGELPEYSVVLRRGMAAAPWVGTTG